MSRASLTVLSCAAVAVGWTACGGDDDESPAPPAAETDASQEAVSDDATPPAEPAAGSDSGSPEAPHHRSRNDAGARKPPVVVDGSTYDYDISAYDCQVGPDIVFVGATDESDAFISATNSGDGGWAGQLQINQPDGDRVYGSLAGLEGTFAVDGTTAVCEGTFGWATRANPGVSEDAGVGTVLIAC